MNQEKRIEFIEHGDLKKVLWTMGIPTMIGMIITALYNVVDAYFVSGLGQSQFAAVSVVFPIVQIMIGIGLTFGSGGGSYVSRLLGAGDHKRANHTASISMLYGLGITTIIILILLTFLTPVLTFVGATDTILSYANHYARIIILASLLTVFNVTMNNLVTAEGKPQKTMIIMTAGALLNIILDPIFIYKLNLGVDGAAYATAISQALSTTLYFSLIVRKKNLIRINLRNTKWDGEIFVQILKIGMPIFLYQLFTSVSMSLTNMAAKPYGDDAIAAMGIMLRVISIGLFMVFGFTKGFMPVIGINFGAKNMERVREAIKITNRWCLRFCFLFGLLIILGSTHIATIFAKGGSAFLIDIASQALIYNGVLFLLFGHQNVYSTAFLAMGKAKEGGLLNLSRQGIFFIPLIFVLPIFFGLKGVLYTQPAADALTIILTRYFVFKNKNMLKGGELI